MQCWGCTLKSHPSETSLVHPARPPDGYEVAARGGISSSPNSLSAGPSRLPTGPFAYSDLFHSHLL